MKKILILCVVSLFGVNHLCGMSASKKMRTAGGDQVGLLSQQELPSLEEQRKTVSDEAWQLYNTLGMSSVSPEKKESAYLEILKILPKYYQVDASEAKKVAKRFSKKMFERPLSWGLFGPRNDVTPFHFLLCIKKLDATLFEHCMEKACGPLLEGVVCSGVLSHPEILQEFEGTALALEPLISQILQCASDKNGSVFEQFLLYGKHHHEQFKDGIMAALPRFINNDILRVGAVIRSLLSATEAPFSVDLRKKAFILVVEQLATSPNHIHDSWIYESDVAELFKCDLIGLIGKNQLDAYRYFAQRCKANDSILGMQLLWKKLAQGADSQERGLLIQNMCEFFNASLASDAGEVSFKQALNTLIQKALEEKTIPLARTLEFLSLVKGSKIDEYISSQVKESYQKMVVLEGVDMPIPLRCQFLSDLLLRRLRSKESINDITTALAAFSSDNPESLHFIKYAQTVIAATQPGLYYHEYFEIRRKLLEYASINKDLNPFPGVLGDYYNVLSRCGQESTHFCRLDQMLENPCLKNGIIYGYKRESGYNHGKFQYRLYACNALPNTSDHGYAIWAAGFTCEDLHLHPFTVADDGIFCVGPENIILWLDAKTGMIVKQWNSKSTDNVYSLNYVAKKKKLCVALEDSLFIIDCEKDQGVSLSLPDHVLTAPTFINEKLIYEIHGESHRPGLFIIDIEGKSQTIWLEKYSARERIGGPRVWGNERNIFYTQSPDDEKSEEIVCLDYESGEKLWTYVSPDELDCMPQLSEDGTRMYLLIGRSNCLALDTTSECPSEKRVLWQSSISIPGESIDEIIVGDDGFIYGLDSTMHDYSLIRFDSKTGAQEFLGKVELGRDRHFVGVVQGKPYIQPISF